MTLSFELLYALLEFSDAYLEKGIGLDDVAVLGYMLAFDCEGGAASAAALLSTPSLTYIARDARGHSPWYLDPLCRH